jgi:nucleotide-binding universal stress UspA family protein
MGIDDGHEGPRPALGAVLAATDLSGESTWAVVRAARLRFAPGGALTILHVLRPEDDAQVEASARRTLEEIGRAGAERGPRVTSAVARGHPATEILRRARAERAELVVLGRHGEGLVRRVLGSTTAQVVRHGEAPALVVATGPEAPYRRLLAASDRSDAAGRALGLAVRLLNPGTRAAAAVHVGEPGLTRSSALAGVDGLAFRRAEEGREAESRSALERWLAEQGGAGIAWDLVFRRGAPAEEILGEAERQGADLVALGTHGRTGLARAFLGSVAEAVLRRAPCDVLLARRAAES